MTEFLLGDGLWISWLWVLATGAAIGSFMNVVIYRIPAGQSIVHPGSRCPHCQQPIRGLDNIPILSWFVLRGKCRDCGARISVRYPVVEAVVAALWLLFFWRDIIAPTPHCPALEEINGRLALLAFHLLLVCSLFCVMAIRLDGHIVPALMVIVPTTLGFVSSTGWPFLRFAAISPFHQASPQLQCGIDGALGILAATAIARIITPTEHSMPPWNMGTLVGGFLGLIGSAIVMATASLLLGLAVAISRFASHRFNYSPWPVCVFSATVMILVANIQSRAAALVTNQHPSTTAMASALVAGSIIAGGWLNRIVETARASRA